MERKHLIMVAGLTLLPCLAQAQLSSNKDKFLGNITTGYSVDYGNEKYYTLWNQITPENESKWGSIEPLWPFHACSPAITKTTVQYMAACPQNCRPDLR